MANLVRLLKKTWNEITNKKNIVNVDYRVVPPESNLEDYLFQINFLKGPYEGLKIAFYGIDIQEDNTLNIQRNILVNPWHGHDFTIDNYFDRLIKDIVFDTIEESIKNYSALRKEILSDENDGTYYIEEPHSQRTVYEKGSSVSKK